MIKIEKWVEETQKKEGLAAVKGVLYFFSLFYKAAVFCRHLLYDIGVFRSTTASIPIISVGNIVCGGTGKSEFVAKLVKDLNRKDLSILSRGYRSRRRGSSRLVKDIDDGDEPFMLSKRCEGVSVIVGKRRELSAALAVSLGKKAAILDDGMQYLSLKKDIEIILVRADDPFGQGFVPYGMRRELLKKMRNVDFIIIHGSEGAKNYELVKKELECYTFAKCFGTRYYLEEDNNKLIGKKVGVFCGIGNPQAFMKQLTKLSLKIVKKKFLADHQKFTDFYDFYNQCKKCGAEVVVCTTKDYVKLSVEEKKLVTPIHISMNISYDREIYQQLIKKINNSIEEKIQLNEG